MKSNTQSNIITYLLPRTQDAVFLCLLLVVCLRGSDLFNSDGDLGRHITIGTYMIKNTAIPYQDIFSHTLVGQALVSHEWLAQILFGAVNLFMGLNGTVLLTAIIIAVTFTLVYQEILRRGVHYLPAVVITMLAAFTSIIHWLARPHIFTFLLLTLWTYNLQKTYEGNLKKLWIFPLIMLIWANIHGAFITGFVIFAAYFAGWLWEYFSGESDWARGKQLIQIISMSFAVTFINPYGWHLWGTSVGYFGNKFLVDYTVEYQSPNFHDFAPWPFLSMIALGLIAPTFGRKLRIHEALLFAGWCALGLYSKRNIPLFAIVTAPYLAYMLQPLFENLALSKRFEQLIANTEQQIRRSLLVMPILAIVLLVIAFNRGIQIDSTGLDNHYDPAKFPVEAVNWLETHPQRGKMFNHFIWGGYLLYRTWPAQSVFIDGQTDFYGEALTLDYVSVVSLQGNWQKVFTKYDVNWAIIKSDESKLAEALQKELGWKVVYQDKTATILHSP